MTRRSRIQWSLAAALAVCAAALPSVATADSYSASFDGGQLTAVADAALTEATIESVTASFGECGGRPGESSCVWEARAILDSEPQTRCDPATPARQVVWSSGPVSGNGTVTGGPAEFGLEGCAGQTLVFELESRYTYEEAASSGPWRVMGGTWITPLFTFGRHPAQEAEEAIVASSPAAHPAPPSPPTLAIADDCRSLTIAKVGYVFAFRGIGCRRASNLAEMRFASRVAPSGYLCRGRASSGGTLCWRAGRPRKYLEWRPPGTRPLHLALAQTCWLGRCQRRGAISPSISTGPQDPGS